MFEGSFCLLCDIGNGSHYEQRGEQDDEHLGDLGHGGLCEGGGVGAGGGLWGSAAGWSMLLILPVVQKLVELVSSIEVEPTAYHTE